MGPFFHSQKANFSRKDLRTRSKETIYHWMFNMGVVVAFMGALAYVVRVYARMVELGAETPAKNPYVAEMYKLALEGKLYSRSIP